MDKPPPDERFDRLFEGWVAENASMLGAFWPDGENTIRFQWSYFDGEIAADGAGSLHPGDAFYNLTYEQMAERATEGIFFKRPGDRALTLMWNEERQDDAE